MLRHFRSALGKPAETPASAQGSTPTPPGDPTSGGAPAAAQALEAMRNRLLLEHGCDVVLIVDASTTVRFANPAATRVLGRPPSALVGRRLVDLLHEDDARAALAMVTDAAANGAQTARAEWRLRERNGEAHVVEAIGRSLLHEPAVGGVMLQLRDVTHRAAERERHAYVSLNDRLTKLPNRTLFRDRVAHALSVAHRRSDPVAVLVMDIDNFRTINDTLGHPTGDALLAAIATRLQTLLRSSDTAARVGADEFAILLEQMSDDSDFLRIAERVRDAFDAPFVLGGRTITVTVSVGIASAVPDDGADDILRNADVALAMARRRGRGGCEIFEPRMHAAIVDRIELEADLQRAISAGEFALHYQPIVILHNRRIAGVEAFLRWNHPRRGLVAPAHFLQIAEDTGLIVPLGRWVLLEACRQGTYWQQELLQERALTVTVNISGVQLRQSQLVTDVGDALRQSGLDPHRLVLEVSDHVVLQGGSQVVARLQQLKALGVRIALDDFGAKHSSLHHLPGLPVDVLKIDKSFIDRVTGAGGDATFAQVIVALGKSMRLRTVAEGVEREDQLAELLRWRCEYGQGTLFSAPLPADELIELLRATDA
jgi:diguanylate cyclase (GGDEF)-like protein/PAS domain S-box-containing protein